MNAVEFVGAIQTAVRDAAANGVMSLLECLPGRKPSPTLVSFSQWFNTLSDDDRRRVREVAMMASDQATFGFFAVLDGVHVINDPPDRGRLELHRSRPTQSVLLNDRNGELLHELLQRPPM